jgi:hypothetical protein
MLAPCICFGADQSDNSFVKGFSYEEAKVFIEFCVETNSQDDLAHGLDPKIYKPQLEGSDWDILKDDKNNLVDSRRLVANGDESVFKNPNLNGFGPYKNAWIIYRKGNSNIYAIAIRGTVVSNSPTVIEDALIGTIMANPGIALNKNGTDRVRFADIENAEVHTGFAYGTVSLLFDNNYGLLKYLLNKKIIPSGSYVYIVGHSQGAPWLHFYILCFITR